MNGKRYELVVAPTARRQLAEQPAEQLPESVAFAAYEFVIGPLLDNPGRVGKQLRPPLDDRPQRASRHLPSDYRIDEEQRTVTVLGVLPRSDAYRS